MDRCDVTATVTLRAKWTASLVGHRSQQEMIDKLRQSLLADVDEVTTLPNVQVLTVEVATDPIIIP